MRRLLERAGRVNQIDHMDRADHVGVIHGNTRSCEKAGASTVALVHKINSEMKQGCARSTINGTHPWNDFVFWIEQKHGQQSAKAVQ